MSANINSQEHNYKNPSVASIIGGVVAGSLLQEAVVVPHHLIGHKLLKKIEKMSGSLTEDEFAQTEKAVVDTIKNSGLESKGVGIIKATKENLGEISGIIKQEYDKGPMKFLPEWMKKIAGDVHSEVIRAGKNACYAFASKKIIMPERNLGLALFHEAGHAMNANLSKFGKVLQKSRYPRLLALPIAMIALFKTKKAPGEKPKESFDKTTTFIKNNAGKLAFAAFVPMLIEEGLASIKGNKFAKRLLSPELAKKVAKTNALGFLSYLSGATLIGLAIFSGTKVKDAIASKKLVTEKSV